MTATVPSETLSEKPAQSPTITPDEAASSIETSSVTLNPAAIRRLNRKLDLHVLPPLFLLYFLSFLDRGNIGNARIHGLKQSLGMAGQDYSIALCIFFVPYVLLEVPSNLILRNCGGIIASNVFLESESPSYTTGFSVCLSLLIMTALLSVGFAVGLSLENRARGRGDSDYRLTGDLSEVDNLGDDHPSYRYAL